MDRPHPIRPTWTRAALAGLTGWILLLAVFAATWHTLAANGAPPHAAALGGLFVLMALGEGILALVWRAWRPPAVPARPPAGPALP